MSLFSLYSGNFSTLDASDLCFSEHHPYEQGFAAHYDQALKPFVELYEAKRLRALSQARARLQWGIPLAVVIALIALYIATAWSPQFGGFLGIAAMGGLGTWIYSSLNSYKADLKSNVFPKILSFFENASYRATCNDRMTSYAESKIVPAFDRENSEDELILTYKGVHINVFETLLEVRRQSDKRTRYISVFDGIVVHLTLHKKFQGITVIKRDSGGVANWFKNKFSSLENVRLEDPKFESKFEVFSSDQIEARYLLTVSFMERLLELENFFQGQGLQASFYNNKLLLMIPMRQNLFEPGSIFVPEDFVDDARALIKEVHLLFQVVDTLKLDMNIGL